MLGFPVVIIIYFVMFLVRPEDYKKLWIPNVVAWITVPGVSALIWSLASLINKMCRDEWKKARALLLIITGFSSIVPAIMFPWYYSENALNIEVLLLGLATFLYPPLFTAIFYAHTPNCYIDYRRYWKHCFAILAIHVVLLLIAIAYSAIFLPSSYPATPASGHMSYFLIYQPANIDFWILLNGGLVLGIEGDHPIQQEGQEMQVQVLDVHNIEDEDFPRPTNKHSCEMCFLVKASQRGCGHIVCGQCVDNFMMTTLNVGHACPLCEVVKTFKNLSDIPSNSQVTNNGNVIEVDLGVPEEPGPSEPPIYCKLCTDRIINRDLSFIPLKECGHNVCKPCMEQHPEKTPGSYPCPFCKLTGVLNGKGSKKTKAKAKAQLDEVMSEGHGSKITVKWPTLEAYENQQKDKKDEQE